jgi:hypothetical protein
MREGRRRYRNPSQKPGTEKLGKGEISMVATAETETQVPFLSAEQVEEMSQDELLAYFARLRQVAERKGVTLPGIKTSQPSASLDSVFSRAAIHARAERAFQTAQARRNETQAGYDEVLARYLKSENLEAVTPEVQAKIDAHVAESLARAQSGYEKISAQNKGKSRRPSNVETAAAEGTANAGAETPSAE